MAGKVIAPQPIFSAPVGVGSPAPFAAFAVAPPAATTVWGNSSFGLATAIGSGVSRTQQFFSNFAAGAREYLFSRGIDMGVIPAMLRVRRPITYIPPNGAPYEAIPGPDGASALRTQEDGAGTTAPTEMKNAPTLPPGPPQKKSPLRWIFDQTFARTDRAVCITTTMGMIEFAGLSPLVNYLTSLIVNLIDPTKVPQFIFPSIGSVGRIGVICALVGAVLFGINGFPKAVQKVLRPTIGRLLSKVMKPKTVDEGFVFGKSPAIRDAHPKVIFDHPRIGEYTVADPITWAYEIGINIGFYPGIGWALRLPLVDMLPTAGLSVFATIGTARMSKIWGSDRRPFWMIALGRTAVFSSMNAVAPLAGSLESTGILSAAAGYAIQAAWILLISGMAYLVVKPKPEGNPTG
jgi:hypothetical protein